MNALLGALVLFLLGLVGARFSFARPGTPLGWRFFFVAGTHFLFIGLLLGPHGFGLLTAAVLGQFYPLLALGLGWVGLLFGLQLDRHQLALLTPRLVALALLQAAFAFLLFLGVGLLAFGWRAPVTAGTVALLGAAAATACVSSPLGIAVVSNFLRERSRLTELLLLIASLDALVGIIALQVSYGFHNPAAGLASASGGIAPLLWPLLAAAMGITFGIIFLWLTRAKPGREELTLFVLGLATFLSGAALHVGFSSLFVGAVAGAVIANLSPVQRRVFRVLHDWEKSIYAVLLVLMGAMLNVTTWLVLPLALAYTAVRLLAKVGGCWLAARLVARRADPPALLGLGLAAQSGMSLVLVLGVALSYDRLDGAASNVTLLVSTVVLAVILSELIGPFLTRFLLRRNQVGMDGAVLVPRRAHAR